MTTAQAVQQLKAQFEPAILSEVSFLGETTLELRKDDLKTVLLFLKDSLGYEVLMDLTGVDYLFPFPRTKIVYWLHNPANLERLRLILYAARDEAIPTVTDIWPGANWYERELFDLFGVIVEGHPDLTRLLMPDDWQGHPLRRDYALTEEPVQFKHGVKPKVPSKIISYDKSRQRAS